MKRNSCIKDEIMIDIENVSMRFNLGIEKGFSFKQFFVDLFNPKKRKKKKNLKEPGNVDEQSIMLLLENFFIEE